MNYSISVIIPAYNSRNFILDALDSLMNQVRPPEQIIVVDDGSTDDTAEKVQDWADLNKQRVDIIKKENRGAASARNAGFQKVTGELVAFLDSDDYMLPNHLELLINAFKNYPDLALAFGITEVQDLGGRTIKRFPDGPIFNVTDISELKKINLLKGSIYCSLIDGSYIGVSSTLVSRRAAELIGYMDETTSPAEDQDFFLRLSKIGKFAFIPATVAIKREHEGNTTHPRHALRSQKADLRVLEKMINSSNKMVLTEEEYCRTLAAIRRKVQNILYSGSRQGCNVFCKTWVHLVHRGYFRRVVRVDPWLRAIQTSLRRTKRNLSENEGY